MWLINPFIHAFAVFACLSANSRDLEAAGKTGSATRESIFAAPFPIVRGHAHNDYWHELPLYGALERGFTSVEVDVFLVGGQLLVAHDLREARQGRTLQSLYLEPLRTWIRQHGGRVHANTNPLILLIDVKSDADASYRALRKVLSEYSDILISFENDQPSQNAVLAVISGNRTRTLMEGDAKRYAAYDGRIEDFSASASSAFMPLVSDNWPRHFTWRGFGKMPDQERQKLIKLVDAAHRRNQLIRFWATPDTPSPEREAIWRELIAAGVDLINTDDLDGLREFLILRELLANR